MTVDIPSRLNAIRHELEASGASRRLLMDIAVEATSIVLTALNRYDRAQFGAEEGGNELACKSESQVLDGLEAAFNCHRPPYEPEFIRDLVAVMAGDEAEIILDLEPPDYWGGLADVSFAYPDSPGPSHVIVHEDRLEVYTYLDDLSELVAGIANGLPPEVLNRQLFDALRGPFEYSGGTASAIVGPQHGKAPLPR